MTVPVAALSSEPVVTTQGTHGVAAMRVDAPAEDVWEAILAVEDWAAFVPHLSRSVVATRSGSGLAGDLDVRTKDLEATLALRIAHPPGAVAPFVAVPADTTVVSSISGMWIVTPIDAQHAALELQLDVATPFWVPEAVDTKARAALARLLVAFAERAER